VHAGTPTAELGPEQWTGGRGEGGRRWLDLGFGAGWGGLGRSYPAGGGLDGRHGDLAMAWPAEMVTTGSP